MRKPKRKKKPFCSPHILRLYKAVAHYIEKSGGRVVLASGIQIIQWPEDKSGQFTVGVKVLGRKPKYADGMAFAEET